MSHPDVVVVGAGLAGLAAALTAAEAGATVVLLDEHETVGGRLRWRIARLQGFEDGALDGRPAYQVAQQLEERLAGCGVDVRTGAVAWGLFDDGILGVSTAEGSFVLQPQRVIVATGSTDLVLPFPGWTLPGVSTARATQIVLHIHRVRPGRRAVVVGSGAEAAEVIDDLALAGVEVVARADDAAQVEALGSRRVERVRVGGEEYAADAVVIALGTQPDPELALQAQVDVVYSPRLGTHVPSRNERLETSRPGLFVVGEAAGTTDPAEIFAEGRVAGLAAAGAPPQQVAAAHEALERTRSTDRRAEMGRLETVSGDGSGVDDPIPSGIAMWTRAVQDDRFAGVPLCRCEQVTVADVRQAIADGAVTVNDIKRRTRAGMGVCQGIFCARAMALLLHVAREVPLAAIEPMTERPPTRAIPLASLAALEGVSL